MRLGLLIRMSLAVVFIFGMVFFFMLAIVYIFAFFGVIQGIWVIIIPMAMALGLVLFRWWSSPRLFKRMFPISWVTPARGFQNSRHESAFHTVERMAHEAGIPTPEFGVITDSSPNALTFGWTRKRAFLVVSNGVFQYCDDDEVEAVIGHEIGHIAHNDFVVMTVVAAIVVMFYVVAEWAWRMMEAYSESSDDDDEGNPVLAAIFVVGVLAFVLYLLANLISLLVSRYREYRSDEFSARATRRPNALASALVKMAYGLSIEGVGLTRAQQGKHDAKFANSLMIFDGKMARSLAAKATMEGGKLSNRGIKDTMSWDLWNPWAFFYELGMTHPLPAKRIQALCEHAEEMGQSPFIDFDLEPVESYWDDFLRDLVAKGAWLFAIPFSIFIAWEGIVNVGEAIGIMILLGSFMGLAYLRLYRYPPWFREAKVIDLLKDPRASPVRGQPVILTGKIAGRGVPGFYSTEDMKIDDGTGRLLIDYRAARKILKKVHGKEITVWGWYRRPVVPQLEVRGMRVRSAKGTNRRPIVYMVLAGIMGAFGLIITILAAY